MLVSWRTLIVHRRTGDSSSSLFFFTDTATTEIYTLSLHDALPILFPEFLESPDARPIRILAEYLEPLRRFKEQKIQDTVVFFGSARVNSREGAERALRMLRARGVDGAEEEYKKELTKSHKAVAWAR